MKIVYAAPGLILRPGMGPCEHFLSVARGLARHPEVDLRLVIGTIGDVDLQAAGIPGRVRVHWLRAPEKAWAVTDSIALGTDPRRYLEHWRGVRACVASLCDGGAPLAVVERMWGFGGLLGGALQRRGARYLLEENGPPNFETRRRHWTDVVRGVYLGASRLRTRRVYRAARQVLVQSEPLKEQLCTAFGAPRDRVVVIPNAIDSALVELPVGPAERAACREALDLPADATVLVYAGSIDASHPVRAVVDRFLASTASRDGAVLLVLGAGYERDAIQRTLRERGATTVRLLPPQGKTELYRYLRAADLSLAPYDLSQFPDGGFYFSPLKVREAMACALPVAVTRGAEGHLVEHDDNGFLVDGDDGWRALFDELPDPARLAEMGAGNRGRVCAYTYDDVADRYLELMGVPVAKDEAVAPAGRP